MDQFPFSKGECELLPIALTIAAVTYLKLKTMYISEIKQKSTYTVILLGTCAPSPHPD